MLFLTYLFLAYHMANKYQNVMMIPEKFLQTFYITDRNGIHRKMYRRPGNEMHYVFLVYPDSGTKFLAADGRPGSYFGMDFVMHGKYAGNLNKVFNLLQTTYDEYVKNKVIQEFPNGNKQWMYANLDANNDKIARYIAAGVEHLLQTRQELNLTGELFPMLPVSNQPQRN